MIDWSKGYSSNYYISVLDPVTWRDTDRLELISGSVSRSIDGLRESASIECSIGEKKVEKWVRVWRNTNQKGERSHDAIFTGLATTPKEKIEGIIKNDSYECYSVLKPAEDVDLSRGWYATPGAVGSDLINQLLTSSTPAPVVCAEDSPTLEDYIIAEDGETNLSMIDKILSAINWRLRIDGEGTIYVGPYESEPVAVFDPYELDILEPTISIEADWFSAPNVFCAISESGITATAVDEDPDSPLSTVNRKREVWMTESGVNLASNETIEQYASRRLEEEQRVEKTAEYTRRYVPNVFPGDVVLLHYPEQGLNGKFMVWSQSVDLSHEAPTDEEVVSYE